jgi:hypothetical protein
MAFTNSMTGGAKTTRLIGFTERPLGIFMTASGFSLAAFVP